MSRKFITCSNCGKKIYEGEEAVFAEGICYRCCSSGCLANLMLNISYSTLSDDFMSRREEEWDGEDEMTISEAIKILKQWNDDLSPYEDEKDGIECHNIAISALEKQIPKKPRKTRTEIVCPACATLVGSSPYCRYCGQKIDWSDTE